MISLSLGASGKRPFKFCCIRSLTLLGCFFPFSFELESMQNLASGDTDWLGAARMSLRQSSWELLNGGSGSHRDICHTWHYPLWEESLLEKSISILVAEKPEPPLWPCFPHLILERQPGIWWDLNSQKPRSSHYFLWGDHWGRLLSGSKHRPVHMCVSANIPVCTQAVYISPCVHVHPESA